MNAQGIPALRGQLVADRYRVRDMVGRGGFGAVVDAWDELSDARVALKLLPLVSRSDEPGVGHDALARIRREIASLRMLRLPGVVRILDDGQHDRWAFIAMQYVEGRAFAASDRPHSWAELAPVVKRLLATLDRIHAAGFVHRDLKPGNVLVNDRGVPVVVDFGLTTNPIVTAESSNAVYGTPRYMAPEIFRGEPATPRSDLYSLGIMLYKALSGELPYPQDKFLELQRARLTNPVPLLDPSEGIPHHLTRLVASLMAISSKDRPQSARTVLDDLQRKDAVSQRHWQAPLLSRADERDFLESSLSRARAVNIVSPPGCGASRLVRSTLASAREKRRPSHFLPAGKAPFESLGALFDLKEHRDASLAEATSTLRRMTRELLESGAVIVVDSWQQCDRLSRELLLDVRSHGCLLTVNGPFEGDIELGALEPEALHQLFTGQERILRMRSAAAQALWKRTSGVPRSVNKTLQFWLDTGLALQTGDKLALPEESLKKLETNLLVPAESLDTLSGDGADVAEVELLGRAALAWPNSTARVLAAVSGETVWRIEARFRDLAASGLVVVDDDGVIWPTIQPRMDVLWSADDRRTVHSNVARALEPGTPGRLLHMLRADFLAEDVVLEVLALSERLRGQGSLQLTVNALREAITLLREADLPLLRRRVLQFWTEVSIGLNTPQALDEVRYVLASHLDDPIVSSLDRLCEAVLDARRSGGADSLARLDDLPPFEESRLERWRQLYRVRATWSMELEDEERVLDEVAQWGEQHPSPEIRSSIKACRGRLAYRSGDFEDAARRHLEAAEEQTGASLLASLLNAASAQLEAFAHGASEETARRAGALAERLRLPHHAAKAFFLERSSRYRRGLLEDVDHDFIEIVRSIDVRYLEALVLLNEAAVAWRNEEGDLAGRLAEESAVTMREIGLAKVALLPRTLKYAALGGIDPQLAIELSENLSGPPRIACQTLGLLAMASNLRLPQWQHRALSLAESVREEQRDLRLEVLSINEVLDSLRLV